MMRTLVVHFVRFGPYHLARLRSAREAFSPEGWKVVGLEIASNDSTYAWREEETGVDAKVTIFNDAVYEDLSATDLRKGVHEALDRLQPAAVAIAGWGSVDARACLAWCRKNRVPAILMSETRRADGKRVWWKEVLKSRIVRRFDGALVGGRSHRDYLVELGIAAGQIQFGYNVVDNDYFARESEKWRSSAETTDRPYFLASNRFITRKNLSRLIEAFATADRNSHGKGWDLCLLGDGELRSELVARCRQLGLEVKECAPWESPADREDGRPTGQGPVVYFPGFCQIDELPRFYALAGCFVHPALEEPWGLVINEAMACHLPVLSGDNVGAAEELVVAGANGWCFDANDVSAITMNLIRMMELGDGNLRTMAVRSTQLLEDKAPLAAFGRGLLAAVGSIGKRENRGGQQP